jgi:hypothetical protein
MLPDGGLHLRDSSREPGELVDMRAFGSAGIGKDLAGLGVEVLPEGCDFVAAVEGLHGLFERDSDEQAEADRGDVNEKAFPGMHSCVGGVDFEHGF